MDPSNGGGRGALGRAAMAASAAAGDQEHAEALGEDQVLLAASFLLPLLLSSTVDIIYIYTNVNICIEPTRNFCLASSPKPWEHSKVLAYRRSFAVLSSARSCEKWGATRPRNSTLPLLVFVDPLVSTPTQ